MAILFSAAAYKNLNTHLMCLGLLSEGHSIVNYGRKQLSMMGSSLSRAKPFVILEAVSFVVCRLLIHAILMTIVVLNPSLFPSKVTHAIASSGMLYLNAVNVRHMFLLPKKEHIA